MAATVDPNIVGCNAPLSPRGTFRSVLMVRRWRDQRHSLLLLHFGCCATSIEVPLPEGHSRKVVDSTDAEWHGSRGPGFPKAYSDGSALIALGPMSCSVYELVEVK